MINISLFFLFAKFGALCFGGGYMIIPLLYHRFVEQTPVFTLEAFGNLLSLSQMTPGAVSVNAATYIGFIQNGVWGAVSATIGLVTPTFILAYLAIHGLKKWEHTLPVQGFLKGARLAALAMILYAVLLFLGMSVITLSVNTPFRFDIHPIALIICVFSMGCLYYNKLSVTKMLVLAGLLGMALQTAAARIAPIATRSLTTTDDTVFDCDDCVNGECGAWTNGCICYRDQLNWSGQNCDEAPTALCTGNTDCPNDTYCNIDKNSRVCTPDVTQGRCFRRTHYTPFQVRGKTFLIARPITNYFSAQNFCAAFGTDWTTATQSDLECAGTGIGCVHPDYVRAFQQKTGIRGFLWLWDTAPNCQAKYLDVNDGAVYNTRMNTVNTAQPLCVYKKGKTK